MQFDLIPAAKEHLKVIENLMQFYVYDFSEYIDLDVEENGLYKPYSNLAEYCKEGGYKWAYIIKNFEKYVGFVLLSKERSEEGYFSVTEFFIMKKYRRKGIGKEVAKQLFTLHRGDWQVHQRENNKSAYQFWNNVINEYTGGQFSEYLENGRTIQKFRS